MKNGGDQINLFFQDTVNQRIIKLIDEDLNLAANAPVISNFYENFSI